VMEDDDPDEVLEKLLDLDSSKSRRQLITGTPDPLLTQVRVSAGSAHLKLLKQLETDVNAELEVGSFVYKLCGYF
jgi:hypothetical protein